MLKTIIRSTLLMLCFALSLSGSQLQARSKAAPMRLWGQQTLKNIDAAFWIPQRNLYADEVTVGKPVPNKPAFMWGCGVQLSALAAAARVDKKTYAPALRRYADALQVYWAQYKGIGGYDVLPVPKPIDRYYDDNEWIVLALIEAYEITRQPVYRERAEQTFRFVMSGEDNKLGGGIYWRENELTSKNTCSNAPAAASALRLYQITRNPEYMNIARRIYDWTNKNLQDKDALFFDNIKLDGKIDQTKWSYNTALMLRTNCLFYAVTKDKRYLSEAQRIARAAEARWVRAADGAITDEAHFAHLLTEAFLFLYERDRNSHWLDVTRRALTTLHEQMRDANGNYGKRWDKLSPAPLTSIRLIDQASAARAYFVASWYK